MNTKIITTTIITITILLAQTVAVFAQSVGINEDDSDPDSSAILDLKSSNKGFLPPRLKDSVIFNITSPATGLVVYSIDANLPLFFDGNDWIRMTTGSVYYKSKPDVSDIDGNVYSTVQIGDQLWMAENLKTTTYNDGISIELIENDSAWNNDSTGAYCWYDNDQVTNADTYGAIYNWHAVNTGNLCPDGWHVPTDEEWKTLEMELGMSQTEADNSSHRGTNEGSKLAGNGTLWNSGSVRNNDAFGSSGFTALPGGQRAPYGEYGDDFKLMEVEGYWWTGTEPSNNWRYIGWGGSGVYRHNNTSPKYGFSVRCLRD